MDADVAKALRQLQNNLKAAQDKIDTLEDIVNANATALTKLIDIVKGHTKSIDKLEQRDTKLEK
jgi:predicted  nucleic acid-binding Zn-ribbon protein